MFTSWTSSSIWKLSYFWFEETFVRKKAVYKEGDPWDKLYLVVEGEFRLYKKLRSGRVDSEIVIISPGEMFGELEVGKDIPRITSCIATRNNSIVLWISRSEFYRRVTNRISMNYFQQLVKLRELLINTRIEQISQYVPPEPPSLMCIKTEPCSRNSLQTSP